MQNTHGTAIEHHSPSGAFTRGKILFGTFALMALLCLLALMAGCSSNSAGSGTASQAAGENESTALVIHVDEAGPLLVDQKTETPYFPTIPVDGLTNLEGQVIEADQLEVGNVVAVTGDNIMLESYPAQYPGIESMRVIAKGNPQDAQKYAEIVDTIFAPVSPESIPVGSLAYSTSVGNVSVTLDPYSYQWFADNNGETAQQALDGSFTDENGLVASGTPDARISQKTDATVTFDRGFQTMQVNRSPLSADSQGQARIALTASQEPVDSRVVENGEAQLSIEPGYAYNMTVKFAEGEASFAFIVTE